MRSRVAIAALAAAVLLGGVLVWRSGLFDSHDQVLTGQPGSASSASSSPGSSAAASASAKASAKPKPSRTAGPSTSPKVKPKPPASQPPLPTGLKTAKVMVLGDSISAGAQDEVMNGYRLDLLNDLPGYPIDYVGTYDRGDSRLKDRDMQAEGGACIRANPCNSTILYDHTAAWITATKPNIVIMQGGGNDYCCGHSQSDSIVIQAMTDWINLVWQTKPDIYIIVIGMIDYHDDYKAWIPKYVNGLHNAGKHIAYVSYDGITTYDTVHPNIAGYQQLADRITPVIRPVLLSMTE